MTDVYLGIDLGTSGCRALAIDAAGTVRGVASVPMPAPIRSGERSEQLPEHWWTALDETLRALLAEVPAASVRAVAVDGTAATVLLTDATGTALTPALLYDDTRARVEARRIAAVAPPESPAAQPGSGLAKLLWLARRPGADRARHALHVADWVTGRLLGRFGVSDVNHCLKMGYDLEAGCWPAWLDALDVRRDWLPRVFTPGTTQGPVTGAIAAAFGLAPDTRVVTGTTDSTAAFLATGARRSGEAVTSLGSTLVLKVIAPAPVAAARFGVYSQPIGGLWLAGGASNSGGAVLRRFFRWDELDALTARLDPEHETGLDYYPLPAPGERFPIADPDLAPRLAPRPADDARFFQGLLEGIARIESRGYRLLAELGAPYPVSVRTVGGGAHNAPWRRIRERLLGVPVLAPEHEDAAYGAALLARRGGGARS